MFGRFFSPVAHLPLDHPRVDPVAAFGQTLPRRSRPTGPHTSVCSPERLLGHSGKRQRRTLSVPVNDNRRGGRLFRRAASLINTRTT